MMKPEKLKVGIVGYGVVGERRRLFIDQHPQLKTVVLCDQKFTEQTGSHDGIRRYNQYQELLAQEKLDILFVCVPNYMAAEVVIAALEQGIHVFCEKPPGRDVADIKRVIEAERKTKSIRLKYGFNHRYHQSVQECLKIIRSHELGEVINLRGIYGKSKIIPFDGGWRAQRKYAGGGILLDQGIHMVDLMQLFCEDFVEVKSFVSNNFWKHDVEDNAYALLRDSKNRIAMLHSSATQWQHSFSLDITLEKGYLSLRGILSGSKSYGEEQLVIGRRDDAMTGSSREETLTFLEDNSWRDEVNEFAASVLYGEPVVHGSSAEALRAMEVVHAIYGADEEWKRRI